MNINSPIESGSGRIVMTTNAAKRLLPNEIATALRRHLQHDSPGGEDHHDRRQFLLRGCKFLSAHRTSSGLRFWVITEANRSIMTVLLPEDY